MRKVRASAGTQEAQVPQAPPGPDARPGQGRHRGAVRRVRAAGSRAGLDHEPSDRGGSYRDDAQDQARREGLDQHLPAQARDQEASRDPDGQWQGEPRVLRSRGQARTRDVRDERRGRAAGARRHDARRPEAPYKDPLPGARRWPVVKAAEARELDVEELEQRLAETRRELFNLRFQHATGQLENTGQLTEARKNIARLLTVLNQKRQENG